MSSSGDMFLFVAMVFIFATLFSIGLVILLTFVKVIRIKRPGDYMTWGVVGGILITFIYVTLMCNKSSSDHIDLSSLLSLAAPEYFL